MLADTYKLPWESLSFDYDMLYFGEKIYCLGEKHCVDEKQVCLNSFDTISHEVAEVVAYKEPKEYMNSWGDRKGVLREEDGRIFYEIDIASESFLGKGMHVCDYIGGNL